MKKIIYIVLLTLIACQAKEEKFYPTGELEAMFHVNNQGDLDGEFIKYYKDGIVETQHNFVNGSLEGISNYYFPNGNLEMEVNFKDGIKNGILREYYKNGEIKSIQQYKNGLKHGDLLFFYDNGNLKMKATSRNDRTIYYKSYSEYKVLTDYYRKLIIMPLNDTVIQGEDFKVDFEILGNLEDIKKVGFLINSRLDTGGSKPFVETSKLEHKYSKTFYARDTGDYLLNLRIWEKDTVHIELHWGLYAKPKQLN
tara:strand:- start:4390 stop:5148 length:759 start_codon:yes stop_codon:yes gene_type:complete